MILCACMMYVLIDLAHMETAALFPYEPIQKQWQKKVRDKAYSNADLGISTLIMAALQLSGVHWLHVHTSRERMYRSI